MKPRWKPSYKRLVDEFITLHFGNVRGVTDAFPYTNPHFKWKAKNPMVLDARTVLKNNIEYHGLERHARQYHLTGMYDYAYHHWLIAASWRRENMAANEFKDEGHRNAYQFDLRNAEYNKALYDWQQSESAIAIPTPEEFGLDRKKMDEMDTVATGELGKYYESEP